MNVKWHSVYYNPWVFLGIFGVGYLMSQTAKWEMENHRQLNLSRRARG